MACSGTNCGRPVTSLTAWAQTGLRSPPPTATVRVRCARRRIARGSAGCRKRCPRRRRGTGAHGRAQGEARHHSPGRGSNTGVRSPAKYGRASRPSLPGGTNAASAISASNDAPPVTVCSQQIRLPAVEVPAANASDPRSTPAVVHRVGSLKYASMTWTRNIVEPYISI